MWVDKGVREKADKMSEELNYYAVTQSSFPMLSSQLNPTCPKCQQPVAGIFPTTCPHCDFNIDAVADRGTTQFQITKTAH